MKSDSAILKDNPTLNIYRVTLKECIDDKFTIVFDCFAENNEHSYEQAEDAYPNCVLINSVKQNEVTA